MQAWYRSHPSCEQYLFVKSAKKCIGMNSWINQLESIPLNQKTRWTNNMHTKLTTNFCKTWEPWKTFKRKRKKKHEKNETNHKDTDQKHWYSKKNTFHTKLCSLRKEVHTLQTLKPIFFWAEMERKRSPVSQCSGAKIFENNFWPKINLAKKWTPKT